MKKVQLLLCFLLYGAFQMLASNSPIMLCNSSGTICTPYSNLNDAYAAANNGDMIYLPAGSFAMPNPLSKEISIIGVGPNNDSSLAVGGRTSINGSFALDANNITLEGLYFYNDITIGNSNSNGSISNLQIKYCRLASLYENATHTRINNSQVIASYFDGYLSFGENNGSANYGEQGSNNFVSNCVLGLLNRGENCSVRNCIFNAVNWNNAIGTVYNSHFEFCIFNTYAIISTSNCSAPSYPDNNIIQNCYYKNNVAYNGCGYYYYFYTSFLNNQILSCTLFDPNNSTYPFNISQAGANIPFPVGNTANIAANHPANLGINGGLFPWNQHGTVPSNPHIYYKNIPDQTSNNVLPVNIKVRSSN